MGGAPKLKLLVGGGAAVVGALKLKGLLAGGACEEGAVEELPPPPPKLKGAAVLVSTLGAGGAKGEGASVLAGCVPKLIGVLPKLKGAGAELVGAAADVVVGGPKLNEGAVFGGSAFVVAGGPKLKGDGFSSAGFAIAAGGPKLNGDAFGASFALVGSSLTAEGKGAKGLAMGFSAVGRENEGGGTG